MVYLDKLSLDIPVQFSGRLGSLPPPSQTQLYSLSSYKVSLAAMTAVVLNNFENFKISHSKNLSFKI